MGLTISSMTNSYKYANNYAKRLASKNDNDKTTESKNTDTLNSFIDKTKSSSLADIANRYNNYRTNYSKLKSSLRELGRDATLKDYTNKVSKVLDEDDANTSSTNSKITTSKDEASKETTTTETSKINSIIEKIEKSEKLDKDTKEAMTSYLKNSKSYEKIDASSLIDYVI